DIAQRLKISAKTVATHKYRSFNKLGVEDVMALSRLALQYGAIERIDA
ncbi:MAG: two-component system response regulator UvrY, partial [Gammaproteobacteria bacterium HGW-Gammaproteobacteria-6]